MATVAKSFKDVPARNNNNNNVATEQRTATEHPFVSSVRLTKAGNTSVFFCHPTPQGTGYAEALLEGDMTAVVKKGYTLLNKDELTKVSERMMVNPETGEEHPVTELTGQLRLKKPAAFSTLSVE